MDTLHEDLRQFMIIFHWILLRTRNTSYNGAEELKTNIFCSI